MKKSIIKTVVLAALMALPMFTKAQTFAGITAEQNAQNTPEGWTAVSLPQLPTITSANTFTLYDNVALVLVLATDKERFVVRCLTIFNEFQSRSCAKVEHSL